MARFTMDIQGQKEKFYLPSLGEITVRQGQTFREDGSWGKELIKYHGEHVRLEGESALEILGKSKDVLANLEGMSASGTKIDTLSLEQRDIPEGFDISLLPNFQVWKNKNLKIFETNVKANKLFEDNFADAVVYVKTSGNDTTGDGSFEAPYRSIYKGG